MEADMAPKRPSARNDRDLDGAAGRGQVAIFLAEHLLVIQRFHEDSQGALFLSATC
jgi:hypothetical protein